MTGGPGKKNNNKTAILSPLTISAKSDHTEAVATVCKNSGRSPNVPNDVDLFVSIKVFVLQ